jgi:type 1 glutamine amidotransferase
MVARPLVAALGACLVGLLTSIACGEEGSGRKKILFFSPSCGYRHSTVTRPLSGELSHSEKIIKELGAKAGYEVAVSQDVNDLKSDDDFKRFDAIIFYTTMNPEINRDAFLKWFRSGKALIGVHCGTDTFWRDVELQGGGVSKGWPEFTRIIGAAFKTHGPNHVPVTIRVEDKSSPATRHLEPEWTIADEIYQFRDESFDKSRIHPLLSIDTEKTDLKPQKMEKGKYYAVSWTREEGKGRVFYTSLGHREDVWTNPTYQKHLMGGIAWALGVEK